MVRSDRRLHHRFIGYMTKHDAWPKTDLFEAWVRNHYDGIKNGAYSSMKKGIPVRVEYIIYLIKYLRERIEESKGASGIGERFRQYLQENGISDIGKVSDPQILNILLEDENDALTRGVFGIFESLSLIKSMRWFVRGIPNEYKLRIYIRQMFIYVGHELDAKYRHLSDEKAIEAAEHHMKVSLEKYQEKAVGWWNFDRWTVVLAKGKRSPTGVSIMLPLKEHAYHAIRNGNMASYEVSPEDLDRPSRMVLVEACAEFAPSFSREYGNNTRNLLMSMLNQCSAISASPGNKKSKPLSFITFAGTEKSRDRLEGYKYKPTGQYMAKTGVELYEKNLGSPLSGDDFVLSSVLSYLGFYSDYGMLPPLDDIQDDDCKDDEINECDH